MEQAASVGRTGPRLGLAHSYRSAQPIRGPQSNPFACAPAAWRSPNSSCTGQPWARDLEPGWPSVGAASAFIGTAAFVLAPGPSGPVPAWGGGTLSVGASLPGLSRWAGTDSLSGAGLPRPRPGLFALWSGRLEGGSTR